MPWSPKPTSLEVLHWGVVGVRHPLWGEGLEEDWENKPVYSSFLIPILTSSSLSSIKGMFTS